MTADQLQLSAMRRHHSAALRAARQREEVAGILATTDPGVSAAAWRASLQYRHAAGEILEDIRWWEGQAGK